MEEERKWKVVGSEKRKKKKEEKPKEVKKEVKKGLKKVVEVPVVGETFKGAYIPPERLKELKRQKEREQKEKQQREKQRRENQRHSMEGERPSFDQLALSFDFHHYSLSLQRLHKEFRTNNDAKLKKWADLFILHFSKSQQLDFSKYGFILVQLYLLS